MRKALIRKKLLVSSRFRETETRNKPFEQEREINRGKKKGEKGKGGNNKKKNRGDRRDERDSNQKAFSSSFAIGRTAFGFYFCHRSARESERERARRSARNVNERDADRIVRERIGGRVNCTLRHQSERRREEKRKDGEGREGEGGARRESVHLVPIRIVAIASNPLHSLGM